MEKIRIRDKHPGSATLHFTFKTREEKKTISIVLKNEKNIGFDIYKVYAVFTNFLFKWKHYTGTS